MSKSRYFFECPLCMSTAESRVREDVSDFATNHMRDVHGGVYSAADDLAIEQTGGQS